MGIDKLSDFLGDFDITFTSTKQQDNGEPLVTTYTVKGNHDSNWIMMKVLRSSTFLEEAVMMMKVQSLLQLILIRLIFRKELKK